MSKPNNPDFIYWEDTWNDKKPKTPKTECCGDWDGEGNCCTKIL